jgi:hypothetical protein
MSIAITTTHDNKGLRVLHGMPRLRAHSQSRPTMHGYMRVMGSAPDPDTIAVLVQAGYDAGTLQTAISLGATDEQLLALPYPADPQEITDASVQLIQSLTARPSIPAPQDVGALQGKANELASQLVAINQQITAQQNQILQLNQRGVNLQTEAANLLTARNKFENAVGTFTTAYRALFGTTPPGLSGLGVDPATLTTVAIALAAVAVIIYEVNQILQANNQSIQLKTSQMATATQQQIATNIASLQQQQNALLAQGKTAEAATIGQQIAQLQQQGMNVALSSQPKAATGFDLNAFFSQYGIWIAAIAGAAIVLPPLIKKL